jgi:acetyl-CoA carboxylase biotin carboxyl carrier protein
VALSDDDIREILRIVDETQLSELRIETNGFSLHVRTADAPPRSDPPRRVDSAAPTAPAPAAERAGGAPRENGELVTVSAPVLGTFYRAESPAKEPFVELGDRVEPDTIVAIVEVMKMMNSVAAGVSGTVAGILAENAQLVEYGQPLFEIDPA